jgi:hypothetical protein
LSVNDFHVAHFPECLGWKVPGSFRTHRLIRVE